MLKNSEMVTVQTPQLTKHIRLYVYSFLDLKTVVTKPLLLSKKERANLKESSIAREGKVFNFKPRYATGCLHD